jgi:hypothetical protein
MKAYYNNGISFRDCGNADQLESDEVFFDHIPDTAELITAFPSYKTALAEYTSLFNKEARNNAYKQESDPIFFKWQRGEATQQEWLDKVNEIKQRWS